MMPAGISSNVAQGCPKRMPVPIRQATCFLSVSSEPFSGAGI